MAIAIRSIPTLYGEDAERFFKESRRGREEYQAYKYRPQHQACRGIPSQAKYVVHYEFRRSTLPMHI